MKHQKGSYRVTFTLLGLIAAATQAKAANIVQNPGFESGSFAPNWNVSLSSGPGSLAEENGSVFAHSGSYSALWDAFSLGNFSATLSQTLTTIAGKAYTLDFFAAAGTTGTTSTLDVTFGGAPVVDLSLPADGNYHEYTYTVDATTTSANLSFAGATNEFIFLDDVSVNPVIAAAPEPFTAALVIIGTAMILLIAAVRRRRPELR